jgi:hypothetical protein
MATVGSRSADYATRARRTTSPRRKKAIKNSGLGGSGTTRIDANQRQLKHSHAASAPQYLGFTGQKARNGTCPLELAAGREAVYRRLLHEMRTVAMNELNGRCVVSAGS